MTNKELATVTDEQIEDEQIETLRTEAGQAGDHAQALICDIALGRVDADNGYEHLRIWAFLSDSDKRKIRQLDEQTARDACTAVIAAGRGGDVNP